MSVGRIAISLSNVKILGSLGYGVIVLSIFIFTLLYSNSSIALAISTPLLFIGLIIAGISWRVLGRYIGFKALRICGLILLLIPFLATITYSIIFYYMLFVRLREIQMKYAALALNIAMAIYPIAIILVTAISISYVAHIVETTLAKVSTSALYIALFLHLISLLPGLATIHIIAYWISAVGYVTLSLNFIKLPNRIFITTIRGY